MTLRHQLDLLEYSKIEKKHLCWKAQNKKKETEDRNMKKKKKKKYLGTFPSITLQYTSCNIVQTQTYI